LLAKILTNTANKIPIPASREIERRMIAMIFSSGITVVFLSRIMINLIMVVFLRNITVVFFKQNYGGFF